MGMFGMDEDFWEKYHTRMHNLNLKKGNVGEHPDRWGGLPQELFPGYKPPELIPENLDNYFVEEWGRIQPWRLHDSDVRNEIFIFVRDLEEGEPFEWASILSMDRFTEVVIEYKSHCFSKVLFKKSQCSFDPHEIALYTTLSNWEIEKIGFLKASQEMKRIADLVLIEEINKGKKNG